MTETVSTLSVACFIIAAIGLVLTIFLWYFLGIKDVIGDLSGRTAKRSIERIRAENKNSEAKRKKNGANRKEERSLFESKTKPQQEKKTAAEDERPETGLLHSNRVTAAPADPTAVLNPSESAAEDATGLLEETDNVTGELNADSQVRETVRRTGGKKLTMLEEIILIHTDEVIE